MAFKKGNKLGNRTGIKHTKETKRKMKLSKLGEKNPSWKGDKVGYKSLHAQIKRHKPKLKFCEICKIKPPYDLANISGKYKRDINDFKWLCRKCHQTSDGRINNLHRNERRKYKDNLIPCTKCKDFKTKEQFSKNKLKQDGLDIWCKKCNSEYYQENKEKIKENQKKHREKPEIKTKRKAYNKKYYLTKKINTN